MKNPFLLLCMLIPLGIAAQNPATISIHFQVNSYILQEDEINLLNEQLKMLPLPASAYNIKISGHTDSDGELDFNQALSKNRSETVKQQLAERGFSPEKIQVKSFGELTPVASNDSPDGKADNRRVEIIFTPGKNILLDRLGLESKVEKFTIDAARGGEIVSTQNGTVITIPPNSLEDENGNAVTGPVDITYQEWRDPYEFIASGLHLGYPHAFSGQQFESDGMFDVRAYKNGKTLRLKRGKTMNVKFEVNENLEGQSFYAFNERTNEWIDQPNAMTNTVAPVNSGNIIGGGNTVPVPCYTTNQGCLNNLIQEAKILTTDYKEDPTKTIENRPLFDIRFNSPLYTGMNYTKAMTEQELQNAYCIKFNYLGKRYFNIVDAGKGNPELSEIRSVRFKIMEYPKGFSPKDLKEMKFADARVIRSLSGNAKITMKDSAGSHVFLCRPALVRSDDPKKASKKDAFQSYSSHLQERREMFNIYARQKMTSEFISLSDSLKPEKELNMNLAPWVKYFSENHDSMRVRYRVDNPTIKRISDNINNLAAQRRYSKNDSLYFAMADSINASGFGNGGSKWKDLNLDRFGFHNCDAISNFITAWHHVNFKGDSAQSIQPGIVYQIFDGINSVYSYDLFHSVSYLRASNNKNSVLIVMDSKGQKYYCPDFNGALRSKGSNGVKPTTATAILLKPFPSDIKDPGELRKMIGLNN